MEFDPEKVRANVRQADSEDLLDRLTVYRNGMEPDALVMIEQELRTRGLTEERIEAHAARHEGKVLHDPAGWAVRCSFCERPAVLRGWDWHRLWGRLPLFPRQFHFCQEHRPESRPIPSL